MTPNDLLQLAQSNSLVLGSASPRRRRLLGETGVTFRQEVSHIEEHLRSGEDPFQFAQRIAAEKAFAVASTCKTNEIVLGGDTVVVLDGTLLGKPVDAPDAIRILELLSGQEHTVGTALALTCGKRLLASGIETTQVFFNRVNRDQIVEYVASEEPLDKAGAYGIQGMGAFLVDRIEGNLDTVIGLPLTLLNHLAREARRQL